MNIFIIVLEVVAAIVALFLIVPLFVKKGYTIKREILIGKPRQDVFGYVKLLRNQDYFNKWVMVDPGMKREFRGIDGTAGFVYGWDSENKQAGKGEQEIKKVAEGERVDMEIRFERPFKAVSQVHIITEAKDNGQTQVKWVFTSQFNYPMNIMLLFINFDKLLGKDMVESLGMLKNILEKK